MREARAHSPYKSWNKERNSGDGSPKNRGIEKNNNSLENGQLLQQRNNNNRKEKAERETNIYPANQLSLHENHVSCSTNPWINNDIIGGPLKPGSELRVKSTRIILIIRIDLIHMTYICNTFNYWLNSA